MNTPTRVPNYELFREAIAIAMGIPPRLFNLNNFLVNGPKGPGRLAEQINSCGTVGCALGWLSTHPKFNELGLTFNRVNSKPIWKGRVCMQSDYDRIAAELFGMTKEDAREVFGTTFFQSRFDRDYTGPRNDDQARLMHRARVWLRSQGQPVSGDPA